MLPAFLFLIGFVFLIKGADFLVDGAFYFADKFGMSQSLAGLTIVAVGTSLPEFATSAMAAYKRNVEIAVGNVVRSNIFNVFFVLGISSTIKPLPFKPGSNIDLGVVIISSLLLFVSMFTGTEKRLDRWEGIFFVLIYSAYIVFLIIKG